MGGSDADERGAAHAHGDDGFQHVFQGGEPALDDTPGKSGLIENDDGVAIAA
jgi:hypothetical protein